MCSIDLEPCSVWNERVRTARKEHSCAGCGAAIQSGDAYSYVSYVGDGTANSEHECFCCWWTRRAFVEEHGCGPTPSYLWEELRDCVDGARSSPWMRHLAALKRRWRTSPIGRKTLAREVFRNAVNRQLALTRRILRKRATL